MGGGGETGQHDGGDGKRADGGGRINRARVGGCGESGRRDEGAGERESRAVGGQEVEEKTAKQRSSLNSSLKSSLNKLKVGESQVERQFRSQVGSQFGSQVGSQVGSSKVHWSDTERGWGGDSRNAKSGGSNGDAKGGGGTVVDSSEWSDIASSFASSDFATSSQLNLSHGRVIGRRITLLLRNFLCHYDFMFIVILQGHSKKSEISAKLLLIFQ